MELRDAVTNAAAEFERMSLKDEARQESGGNHETDHHGRQAHGGAGESLQSAHWGSRPAATVFRLVLVNRLRERARSSTHRRATMKSVETEAI